MGRTARSDLPPTNCDDWYLQHGGELTTSVIALLTTPVTRDENAKTAKASLASHELNCVITGAVNACKLSGRKRHTHTHTTDRLRYLDHNLCNRTLCPNIYPSLRLGLGFSTRVELLRSRLVSAINVYAKVSAGLRWLLLMLQH